jgi:DNA-3-methyladenine glycosylase
LSILPDILNSEKLDRSFYIRDVLTVSKELLGKIFVKNDGKRIFAGRIVEVEAYNGAVDEAAQTYIGRTSRNEIMFGIGGFLYVYFTYGMYCCCNVVAGAEGFGEAVLIRGLEPIWGLEFMAFNRYDGDLSYWVNRPMAGKELYNLTNGPGKLCMALDIKKTNNGTDLLGNKIYLLDQKNIPNDKIVTATRIGITKSVHLPWRFFIKDNPFVSRTKI